jgi:hypothetical protein
MLMNEENDALLNQFHKNSNGFLLPDTLRISSLALGKALKRQ